MIIMTGPFLLEAIINVPDKRRPNMQKMIQNVKSELVESKYFISDQLFLATLNVYRLFSS